MKKILPLFLIIVYISNAGLKFDYQRLDMHYDGLVFNNNYIFFYGANNSIARTDLNNENWELIKIIDEETDIIKIRNEDNGFYGISEQSVFRLNSEGKPLSTKSFEAVSEFKDVIKLDNNFFILNENSIDILDNDFEKINSVFFNENIVTTKMELFNDNLIVGTTNGSLYSFVNGIDNQPEIFDFVEKGYLDSAAKIYRFKKYNSDLYILVGSSIYQTNDLKNYTKKNSGSLVFNIYDDNIYSIHSYTGFGSSDFNLVKFCRSSDSIVEQISNPELDRYCEMLRIIGFEFINSNLIFAYGSQNLILRSTDGGYNWELISYLNPSGNIQWVNVNTGYQTEKKEEIYKTRNGGVTWQTQKTGNYNLKNWSLGYSYFYSEDGRGVIFGSHSLVNNPTTFYTKDYGDTWDTTCIDEIYGYGFSRNAPIIRINDEYKVFYPSRFKSLYYTLIFTLDLDMNCKSTECVDSANLFNIQKYNDKYYALSFDGRHEDGYGVDTNTYQILTADAPGIAWDTLINLSMMDTSISYMSIIDDNIYLGGIIWYPDEDTASRNVLYKVDIEKNTYQRLKLITGESFKRLIKWENKIIAGAKDGLIYCDDIENNPYNWKKEPVPGYYPWIITGFFDNIMYAYTPDRHFLKFTFHEDTPVEEPGAEVIKMYNYPPYPQPANNHVSTEIYWDARYDMQNATITVHDYTGKTISKPGEISVNKMNIYHGEIIWDCSSVSSGVYFINIRLGGTTRTVPVVVGR